LGQFMAQGGAVKLVTVWPHDVAAAKPIYPAP
jgi:hypothetical protein